MVCDAAAAKPPYLHNDAEGATLTGDITIGPETVVFPGAQIRSCEGAGPVVIGRGCVLEEGACLMNSGPGEMRVGDGNLFEVGCTVRAQQVGLREMGADGSSGTGMHARVYVCCIRARAGGIADSACMFSFRSDLLSMRHVLGSCAWRSALLVLYQYSLFLRNIDSRLWHTPLPDLSM